MAQYPFQRDLKRRLEGFMADLDKKLSRNSERLAAQEVPSITAADQVIPIYPLVYLQDQFRTMGPCK